MTAIKANGITIEYETFGDRSDPALLLVMGLGGQLTLWPEAFCRLLADRGFYVIRYDNRDIGLSEKFDSAGLPDLAAAMAAAYGGKKLTPPYSLADMAADGIGLLDGLGIERAHIAGASMGGMIVQHMGFGFPERVLSLTSIMSTTGDLSLPQPSPEVLGALLAPAAPLEDREAVIAQGIKLWQTIGSPGYPQDEAELRRRVGEMVERSYHPAGVARQMVAIMADGSRRERLKGVRAPSVVLHGRADPLVLVQGGEDTAAHIEGAELRMIEGWGHDLPEALFEQIADGIASAARRADSAAGLAAE